MRNRPLRPSNGILAHQPPRSLACIAITLIIACGLGCAIFGPSKPILSSDAYRYVWDGRVAAHGINPYHFAPNAAALSHLRDSKVHPHIFRPDMRTVYPPGAQGLFWLAARLTPGRMGSFAALRILYVLHVACAILLLLLGCFRTRSRAAFASMDSTRSQVLTHHTDSSDSRAAGCRSSTNLARCALFLACSPLVLFYGFFDYHLDILLLPYIVIAFFYFDRSQIASGLSLAMAILIRPLCLWIAPVLIFDAIRLRRYRFLAASIGATIATLAYAYSVSGSAIYESLLRYSEEWVFNSMIYSALVWCLQLEGQDSLLRTLLFAASVIIATAIAAYAVCRIQTTTRSLSSADTRRADAAILGCLAYVWCTPTLYPWYLLCIQPLFALTDKVGGTALGLALMLSETVYLVGTVGGSWEPPLVIRLLEALTLIWVTHRTLQRLIRPG